MLESIKAELVEIFDENVVNSLLDEYNEIKKFYFLGDWQKVVLHAGRFAEISIACANFIVTGQSINLNGIRFGKIFDSLIKWPVTSPKIELFSKELPRVAKAIYTLRNKKNVAHVKVLNPEAVDASLCIEGVKWILFHLVVYNTSLSEGILEEIDRTIKKEIPIIEEFEDGGIIILDENISLSDAILLFLYKKSKRVTRKFIFENLRPFPKNRQRIDIEIRKLKKEKLIDENKDGCILTKKGLLYVETIYRNRLSMSWQNI